MVRYLSAFTRVIVANPEALWRKTERTIIWGKMRRTTIACIPGLASHLKRKYRLLGGCVSCGASCNLLFKCPHWDEGSRLCSIYDDRPLACRLFPITPADLRDRDLASDGTTCGYSLVPNRSRGAPVTEGRQPLIVLQQVSSGRQDLRQAQDSGQVVRPGDAADRRGESFDFP